MHMKVFIKRTKILFVESAPMAMQFTSEFPTCMNLLLKTELLARKKCKKRPYFFSFKINLENILHSWAQGSWKEQRKQCKFY